MVLLSNLTLESLNASLIDLQKDSGNNLETCTSFDLQGINSALIRAGRNLGVNCNNRITSISLRQINAALNRIEQEKGV